MANSQTKKIFIGSLFVVVAVVAVGINFIPVREEKISFTEHTTNAGELISGTLVGQTFVAREDNLSAVAVKFATYSNRANSGSVEFHLRRSINEGEDLRTATVSAEDLGDNQLHRFEFAPISDSAGGTFFFYLTSPASLPGNAVTVDLDTRDPYHEGSAYLIRAEPSLLLAPDVIARSGKQTVDVVFATYHTTNLRSAVITSVRLFVQSLVITWDDRQGWYLLWIQLLAPLIALGALLVYLRRWASTGDVLPQKTVIGILSATVAIGLLFRFLYAAAMPVTNDEGNYLYDAASLLRGTLAGGDGYVKAPLVILWLALWQTLVGHTVFAGRLAMLVVSAGLSLPLYFVTRAALPSGGGQRAGLLAAALWAVLGAPAVFGIYVHTQTVALLFGVLGIMCLWIALRREEPEGHWFVISGILLGLGVASRKSILALGLVPLVLLLLLSFNNRQRGMRLLMVGISFACVMIVFVTAAVLVYGCESPLFLVQEGARCVGLEEALGINSAEDGLSAVTPEEEENARAYSLRGMTPFFRESLPLIFLSVLGWGLVIERAARELLRRWRLAHKRLTPRWIDISLPKVGWLIPALALWWGWSFFMEYEGSVFHELGAMKWLWYAFGALIVVLALWPPAAAEHEAIPEKPTPPPILLKPGPTNVAHQTLAAAPTLPIIPLWLRDMRSLLVAALLPLLWVGGLAFFYMNWIKFHANYIVEFLPPLAIMSGLGVYLVVQRLAGRALYNRVVWVVFLAVVGWSGYLSNYVTYVFPHTGTFDQASIQEAATWASTNIPTADSIFTGAAVVPYLSGHRVALDIAHPRWYAYEFTRKDTPRLNTFLPSIEEMLAAYREADWFLLEQQTGFSFLMEYTEIEAGLARDWTVVHEVENLSNPLTFYKRK